MIKMTRIECKNTLAVAYPHRRYKLINYDVWGNRADGFEVNDAHYTGIEIDLPCDFKDIELRRALYKCGFCNRGILTAKLQIEGEEEYTIYVNLIGSRYGLKPFCELRSIALYELTGK